MFDPQGGTQGTAAEAAQKFWPMGYQLAQGLTLV